MVRSVLNQVEAWVKTCTKPTSESLIGGAATDLIKSKSELIAENAFLRQPLIVMKRKVTHPKLTSTDRGLLVALASRVRGWKSALLIVKPDTLLKWQQQGFKLLWRLKSKGEARKPRISEATIALIKQMAIENRRWGAKRIRGELLKPGIQVNNGTIRRYTSRGEKLRFFEHLKMQGERGIQSAFMLGMGLCQTVDNRSFERREFVVVSGI